MVTRQKADVAGREATLPAQGLQDWVFISTVWPLGLLWAPVSGTVQREWVRSGSCDSEASQTVLGRPPLRPRVVPSHSDKDSARL